MPKVREARLGYNFTRVIRLQFPTLSLSGSGVFGTIYKDAASHATPFDLPNSSQGFASATVTLAGSVISEILHFVYDPFAPFSITYKLTTIDETGADIETILTHDLSVADTNTFLTGTMHGFLTTGKYICGVRAEIVATGGTFTATISSNAVMIVEGVD
jgi:hypothetical protein